MNKLKQMWYWVVPALLLVNTACSQSKEFSSSPPSHVAWDGLLKEYVDEQGMVDYARLQEDSTELNDYLDLLSAHHPNGGWTKEERLAYWINAYNAYTLRLIIRNYPLKGIKDITFVNIPMVHSPWDLKFIEIEGELYDLNNIEHGIIREEFDVPEIHFALVCAAQSCPRLRREAYVSDRLMDQLQDQARDFLADSRKNEFQPNVAEVSKIFLWYKGDFTDSGSLIDYISKYVPMKLKKDTEIDYMSYDWSLNDQ